MRERGHWNCNEKPPSTSLYIDDSHLEVTEVPDQKDPSTTVATPPDWDVAKTWITGLRAKSPKTARAYADAINGFLESVNKPVADISVEDAVEYVSHLSESGPASPAVNHQVSAIRSFLRHCQGLGIIEQTPLHALNGDGATASSIDRHVPPDEVERLQAAAKNLLNQHPLGLPGKISTVLGAALPLLIWMLNDEKTVLGSLVLLITVPLWMSAVRVLLYIGQWMLTEPERAP